MISLQDLNEGMTDCNSVMLVCPICNSERIKVLRILGLFTDSQDFAENVKQVGLDISSIDDASYFLVEAIKR